jgi:hypothetical protein
VNAGREETCLTSRPSTASPTKPEGAFVNAYLVETASAGRRAFEGDEPTGELQFLMELSIEPVAAHIGLLAQTT